LRLLLSFLLTNRFFFADELGLDRQFVAGKAHRLTGKFFGNAADFEHDSSGFNNCYPVIGGAFTRTHSGLSRLAGVRLVGENLDPYLAATFNVTGHGDTGRLNL